MNVHIILQSNGVLSHKLCSLEIVISQIQLQADKTIYSRISISQILNVLSLLIT